MGGFHVEKGEDSAKKDFGSFILSRVSSSTQPSQAVFVKKRKMKFFSQNLDLGWEPKFLTVLPCSWLSLSLFEGILVLAISYLARVPLIVIVGLKFHRLRRGEQEPS